MLDRAAPGHDLDGAIAFLMALRPAGPWNLTAIAPDGPIASATFSDAEAARVWLGRYVERANLHYCANPASKPTGRGGRVAKDDLDRIEFLHGDFDLDKLPDDHSLAGQSLDERKHTVEFDMSLATPPSLLIDTGGGLQGIWRLARPLDATSENIAWTEDANRWLATQFAGGEPQCADAAHLLRLPGTLNLPNAKKRSRGRTVAQARLRHRGSEQHAGEAFGQVPAPTRAAIDIVLGAPEETDLYTLVAERALPDRLVTIIREGEVSGEIRRGDTSRSAWMFEAVCGLVRHGVEPEQILWLLLDADLGFSASVIDPAKGSPEQQLAYAERQVRNALSIVAGEREDDRRTLMDNPVDAEWLQDAHRDDVASDSKLKKTTFRFTPYLRKDPKAIAPRDFLLKPNYVRKFATGTLAHGGVGKSILLMAEAIALASGLPLYYATPRERFRVVYWNGEDPQEELDRRLEAICKQFEIPHNATAGRLFVDSGRTLPINVVTLDPKTRMAVPKDVDAIVEALLAERIDILTIDPSVASHSVPENQNEMAEKVAQAWNDVAERANVAVHLAHHAVKARGREVEAMDFRGGGASLAKLRHLRVLNRMSKDEAKDAGIMADQAWRYVRTDDGGKNNLLPPSEARWYQMVSVDLQNADVKRDGFENAESDVIGVPIRWDFPETIRVDIRISRDEIAEVFKLMGDKVWKKTAAAGEEWVGHPIAKVAEYDLSIDANRKGVERLIKTWEARGVLATRKPEKGDKHGNRREGFVPGAIPDQWLP